MRKPGPSPVPHRSSAPQSFPENAQYPRSICCKRSDRKNSERSRCCWSSHQCCRVRPHQSLLGAHLKACRHDWSESVDLPDVQPLFTGPAIALTLYIGRELAGAKRPFSQVPASMYHTALMPLLCIAVIRLEEASNPSTSINIPTFKSYAARRHARKLGPLPGRFHRRMPCRGALGLKLAVSPTWRVPGTKEECGGMLLHESSLRFLDEASAAG